MDPKEGVDNQTVYCIEQRKASPPSTLLRPPPERGRESPESQSLTILPPFFLPSSELFFLFCTSSSPLFSVTY